MKRAILYPMLIFVLISTACVMGGKTAVPTATTAPTEIPTAQPLQGLAVPTETIAQPPTSVPEPTETMPVVEEPTQVPEEPTQAPVEPTQEPTTPPPADTGGIYREEFSDPARLSSWLYLYVTGNSQGKAKFDENDDKFNIRLPQKEETDFKLYTTDTSYTDMFVSAEVENLGDSNNGVGLLCRVSDKGFYEFRISSSGLYAIYRYDAVLKKAKQPPYVHIAEGGSPLIRTGKKINSIAMDCSGSDFKFYINDQLLKTNITTTLKEEFSKLPEGGFGLSAISYNETGSPVEVNFNWIQVEAAGAQAGQQTGAQPTQAASSGGGAQGDFYREDFTDANAINAWQYLYVTGNSQGKAKFTEEDDKFKVYLPTGEEAHLKLYNVEKTYSDVGVQAEAENIGNNNNGISVLCRVSDKGWYEFRISSSGLYAIYRYDPVLKKQGINPYVFIEEGGSPLIRTGKKINTLAMYCTGSDFSFYINGQKLKTNISTTLREEFAKLPEGGFGFGTWAFPESGSPVEVYFNWVETFQPQ